MGDLPTDLGGLTARTSAYWWFTHWPKIVTLHQYSPHCTFKKVVMLHSTVFWSPWDGHEHSIVRIQALA
ncbi:hypothetical protein BHE74_00028893 [Ensete ventricosum]|nr:hypothetical protein BHE74_00028893 [Ensete ventricosum]